MGNLRRVLRVALATLFAISAFGQEEVELEITRSVKVTFQSESDKSYQLLSATNPDAEQFQAVGEPVAGNGGKITVFYESEDDQKVFFKVEESNSNQQTGRIDIIEKQVKRLSDLVDKALFLGSDRLPILGNRLAEIDQFKGIDFSGIVFSAVRFRLIDFSTANFRNTKWWLCVFDECNLSECDFRGSILEMGAPSNNAPLFFNCNLRNANFSNLDLFEGSLFNSDLTGADFKNSKLHDVNFGGTDLTNADLAGSTGFNPDQPWIIFNNTTMPDGTVRTD